jgi:hypothetical protein
MHCNKCKTEVYDTKGKFLGYHQGRVFVDQVFSGNTHVELFCVRCGKRWMIDKTKGAFGAWLDRKVRSTI